MKEFIESRIFQVRSSVSETGLLRMESEDLGTIGVSIDMPAEPISPHHAISGWKVRARVKPDSVDGTLHLKNLQHVRADKIKYLKIRSVSEASFVQTCTCYFEDWFR